MRIAAVVLGLPSLVLLVVARIELGGASSVRPKAQTVVTHLVFVRRYWKPILERNIGNIKHAPGFNPIPQKNALETFRLGRRDRSRRHSQESRIASPSSDVARTYPLWIRCAASSLNPIG